MAISLAVLLGMTRVYSSVDSEGTTPARVTSNSVPVLPESDLSSSREDGGVRVTDAENSCEGVRETGAGGTDVTKK